MTHVQKNNVQETTLKVGMRVRFPEGGARRMLRSRERTRQVQFLPMVRKFLTLSYAYIIMLWSLSPVV